MQVYLIRHGSAVPGGAPGALHDSDRDLTPAGAKKIRRNAAALVQLGVVVDEVWTSPLARALHTANLLAEEFGLAGGVRVLDALQPGSDFAAITSELEKCSHRSGIAMVGHEPDLGELATYLITGLRNGAVRFKKGSVACIEIDDFKPPVRGELCWLMTPKQMAEIATQ